MKAKELREKNLAELKTTLLGLLKEQLKLRLIKQEGEATKFHRFKQLRRAIARTLTIMAEKHKEGKA